MASVRLDVDNWIQVTKDDIEVFGKIIDYTRDENDSGRHWVKVQLKWNITENSSMDFEYSFTSEELSHAPTLRVYEPNNGEEYMHYLERRANSRRSRLSRNERSIGDILDEIVNSLPDEETTQPEINEEDTHEEGRTRTRAVRSDRLEQSNGEDEPARRDISYNDYREPSAGEFGIPADFEVNLTSGNLKTLINIAEKNPTIVFNVIDNAVDSIGHILFNYLSTELQKTFIELKIDKVLHTKKVQLVPKEAYVFRNEANQQATMVYCGGTRWFSHESTIPELRAGTVTDFSQESLDNYKVKLSQENSFLHGTIRELIDAGVSFGEGTQYIFRERKSPLGKIKARDISNKWQNVITNSVFAGVNLPLEKIDLDTFKYGDVINNIIKARGELESVTDAA